MTDSNAERVLAQFFIEREGEGVMDGVRDVDLIDSGMLDSLDLVTLSTHIDMQLGRKLDLSDGATFEAMRRYDTLLALVVAKTSDRPTDR